MNFGAQHLRFRTKLAPETIGPRVTTTRVPGWSTRWLDATRLVVVLASAEHTSDLEGAPGVHDRSVETFSYVLSPKVAGTVVDLLNAVFSSQQLLQNVAEWVFLDKKVLYDLCCRALTTSTQWDVYHLEFTLLSGVTTYIRFLGQLTC